MSLRATAISYDLVVAGARSGASVCLLEKESALGGLATLGNVTVWLPLCDGRGRQAMGGLTEELLRLSVEDLARDNKEPQVNNFPLGMADSPGVWRTKWESY